MPFNKIEKLRHERTQFDNNEYHDQITFFILMILFLFSKIFQTFGLYFPNFIPLSYI